MAAVTSADVTVVRAWTEGGVTGKERKCLLVRVLIGNEGGSLGDLPASAFGLTEIEEVSTAMDSGDSAAYTLVPTYARTAILIFATDGDGAPAFVNVDETLQFIVKGF